MVGGAREKNATTKNLGLKAIESEINACTHTKNTHTDLTFTHSMHITPHHYMQISHTHTHVTGD